MHVSADVLGFQMSFTVEPRSRPARREPAPDLVTRLRARLALTGRRPASRLENLRADQLADVGLPPDWRLRSEGRSHSTDLLCRSMVPF